MENVTIVSHLTPQEWKKSWEDKVVEDTKQNMRAYQQQNCYWGHFKNDRDFTICGIAFHKTPISYVRAITESAESAGGIILQFPFYAGIQGMMVTVGSNGVSLASAISTAFVNISTPRTFPVLCYLAAGIVNFFVPSGGGQWAVQGPIMMPAGLELGVTPAVTAMGIAWGDAWTNMLQPFWALPALGIAGLGARDIMGYCAIVLIASGIVTALGFLFLVPLLA